MATTIMQSAFERRRTSPNGTATIHRSGGRWISYTWKDLCSLIEAFAGSLRARGLKAGDNVALASQTRVEWLIADLAVMGMGARLVPLYPNNTEDEMAYILNDSEARMLVLEDIRQYDKWRRIREQCPKIELVVVIDRLDSPPADVTTWGECLTKGREELAAHPSFFQEELKQRRRDEIATIIYTSGTTGRPKGVVLCHEQVMSEIEDVFDNITVNETDVALTFLPYSHILGRIEGWGAAHAGYTLAFAESIERVKNNLIDIRPTFMIAVPRIFEKLAAAIRAGTENARWKSELFENAVNVGKQMSDVIAKGESPNMLLLGRYKIMDALVFKKIRNALGGRLRFAVCGGAALHPDLARFFHGAGILVCEGYGLTETTAAVAFNTPLHYRFGTVGRPFGDVKVRIDGDGEILIKSKKVMREYFRNDDATKEVFTEDGYFRTGDIGELDADGYLRITDRKKDLIKTAGGKYVAPQKLESLLKKSPYVSNVLVHGEKRKYVVALLTLNEALLAEWAGRQGIQFDTHAALVADERVQNLARDIIAEANQSLGSFESIKKFAVIPQEFTVETGELTPSLKVKRKFCDEKYKDVLDGLYGV